MNWIMRSLLIGFAMLASTGLYAIPVVDELNDKFDDVLGDVLDNAPPGKDEFFKEAWDAFFFKTYNQSEYRNFGCSCTLKNEQSDPIYYADMNIPQSPHVYFWGDSRVMGMNQMMPFVFAQHSGKIRNLGIGGGTSDDLADYFDNCGNREYNHFYPEPLPGHPEQKQHVQLENRVSIVLTGGNDFQSYKKVLQAIPWLIPFRHNNILNNLNRVVSYHQAQNAHVIIQGQLPLTGAVTNINVFGGQYVPVLSEIERKILTPLGESISNNELIKVNDDTVCLGAAGCFSHPNLEIFNDFVIFSEAGIITRLLSGVSEAAINELCCEGQPTDNTFVSQQMGYLTAMTVPFVVQARNVGFVNTWPEFMDTDHFRHGRWWIANRGLYENGAASGDTFPPELKTDGVHPNALGNKIIGLKLESALENSGLENSLMPAQGDRCQYGPHSVFETGQPPLWTDEPPELPALDDNTLILIALCIWLGQCDGLINK